MREHSTAHLIVVADAASPIPIGVLSSLDVVRAVAEGG
jgi:CBS domain-containing protein